MMPQGAGPAAHEDPGWTYQNDVKVSMCKLAAREGYESVEHTKRYTTLGMATDQGKLSNINGLAILAQCNLNAEIPAVGTTTFRPPYTPISMGAIAGEARGPVFQPIRRTPIHDWHEAQAALIGNRSAIGGGPIAMSKSGEATHEAVNREVLATRNSLGSARCLDAWQVDPGQGPRCGQVSGHDVHQHDVHAEAGQMPLWPDVFNENGFLMDDGVVARLDEDTWLVPHNHGRGRTHSCPYGRIGCRPNGGTGKSMSPT